VNKTSEAFVDDCTSCGACANACPFLVQYGSPECILNSADDTVFLCTNCRACTTVCPSGLAPDEAFFAEKTERIRSGQLSERVRKTLHGARAYAERGRLFPFSVWKPQKTVFWPGCGLTGANPGSVYETRKQLVITLTEPVGLVIDCCFDPLWQLGDVDAVRTAVARIAARLQKCNVERVITGCVNCTKVLSEMLPGVMVQHALEVLPPDAFDVPAASVSLHHPCPSARIPALREKAAECAAGEQESNGIPLCCGCGGGLHVTDQALSLAFAEKALVQAAGGNVVTYCMGCKGTFQAMGFAASHLLEYLPGAAPITAPVSAAKKWLNRLGLGLRVRLLNPQLLIGVGLLMLIVLTSWLRQQGYISMDGIVVFLREHPLLAPILFILVYAIGPSVFLPSLPLTLGAGFLWGPFWGVVFSIVGSTTGASIAFLLARYVLRDTVKARYGYDRWQSLSVRVEQHGWKAVAFARLVPIFPFPILNFLFGVTPIPFLHYVGSSFVFMLPACIAYVAFGSSMGELILRGNIKGLVIGIVIASVALLLPFLLKPVLKRWSDER
jgi:uncharacterized membrane protein YdjX (TVP38/TMEM64 family)/ferredoxin